MVTDLKTEAERVRACADKRDSRSLQIVEEALESKWEGLESLALQVLGGWGDDESRRRLRSFLEVAGERPYGWAIRGVAVKALASCVNSADAPWVLDRYFGVSGVLAKHELLPVVVSLPLEAIRSRLLDESLSTDRDNRQAAMKAIGNVGFADRSDLLQKFVNDADADIRRGANILIRRATTATAT